MSCEVARLLIAEKIKELRKLTYGELLKFMKRPTVYAAKGPDGKEYCLEVEVFWDSKKGGNLRVLVCGDASGFDAFRPETDDFILAPDGTCVGENPARRFT